MDCADAIAKFSSSNDSIGEQRYDHSDNESILRIAIGPIVPSRGQQCRCSTIPLPQHLLLSVDSPSGYWTFVAFTYS